MLGAKVEKKLIIPDSYLCYDFANHFYIDDKVMIELHGSDSKICGYIKEMEDLFIEVFDEYTEKLCKVYYDGIYGIREWR